MRRITRTWRIAKAAWRVLSQERSLLAVSVLTHLAALVAVVAVFFAGLVAASVTGFDEGRDVVTWVVVALAALAGTWVSSTGQGVVIAGAAERMEGEQPTVGSAFALIRGRIWQLVGWAVIATAVGRVLDVLRRRGGTAGTTASSGGRFAFNVVAFLALPVIVLEDTGAVRSLKRSWELMKDTWGENVTFNFGLKLLGVLLCAPIAAVVALAIWAGVEPLPLAGLIGIALYGVAVAGGISALSAVFKTALYRWATDRPVDPAFDGAQLKEAFAQS